MGQDQPFKQPLPENETQLVLIWAYYIVKILLLRLSAVLNKLFQLEILAL